jgi:hypothetical protein
LALSVVQLGITRAVALAYDEGILFGSGVAPEPRGVANTPGIIVESGVPLDSLAGFASAIGNLPATNPQPRALVMNPVDLGTLLGVTEGDGSTVPLWKTAISGAQGCRCRTSAHRCTSLPRVPRGKRCCSIPAP